MPERPTRPGRPLRPDLRARRLRRRHASRGSTASRSHETVQRAIVALENLEHRGAAGADPNTGDGAGILLQMPDEFLRGVIDDGPAAARRLRRLRLLPARATTERRAELEAAARGRPSSAEGQRVVGWRDVPVDKDYVGITANLYAPYIKQLVVAASRRARGRPGRVRAQALRDPPRGRDRRRPGARDPVASAAARSSTRACSPRPQLLGYYPDLQDPRTQVARSRSSTRASPPTRSRAGSSRTRTG